MHKTWAIASLVVTELYRRKDVYVLFLLTALITVCLGSISFFSDRSVVRYLKEVSLLLIWYSGLIISIVTVARQIPAERESRTIFPLLAKPVTRAEVIAGKFLGCWLASGIALLSFYLFFALVIGMEERAYPWASYVQALGLHWAMLAIVIAFGLLGSLVFAAPSSTATISFVAVLALLLVGKHLNAVAAGLTSPAGALVYALYFLLPHLEFFDLRDWIVHGWGAVSWGAFAVAMLYAAAYTSFFLIAAWWVFRQKGLELK